MVFFDLQSGILIVCFVPRKDRRIIVVVLSSIQIDSDSCRRNDLPALDLRGKIVSGISVLQLIIIVWLAVRILIFGEFPEHRADLQPVPLKILADLISRDQISFVINNVELIFIFGSVPYTGIYDDLLTVLNLTDADLLGGIYNKIIVRDNR